MRKQPKKASPESTGQAFLSLDEYLIEDFDKQDKSVGEQSTGQAFLSLDEYHPWRVKVSELLIAQGKLREVELKAQILRLQADKASLEAELFGHRVVQTEKAKVAEASKSYEEGKAGIESRLGHSLNGFAIDDFTFEVRKLPG